MFEKSKEIDGGERKIEYQDQSGKEQKNEKMDR